MVTTKTPPARKASTPRAAAKHNELADAAAVTTKKRVPDHGWALLEPVPVSPEQRMRMIQDAAYFRAERRGFVNGDPVRDWVEAEAEVDRLIQESPSQE